MKIRFQVNGRIITAQPGDTVEVKIPVDIRGENITVTVASFEILDVKP